MRVLVTTHAQLYQTPDGKIWTKSVYGYSFFKRYLDVFEETRLVCRLKEAEYDEVSDYLLVEGKSLEIYPLPFYRGPWEYAKVSVKLDRQINDAILGCDCAILRIPDQFSFQLYRKLKKNKIKYAVEVVAHPWDLLAPSNNKTVLRPFIRLYWDYMQKKICSEANGVSYVTKKYIQMRYPSHIENRDRERFETNYTSAEIKDEYYFRPREEDEFIKKGILKFIHISGINDFAKGHKELLEALSILKKMGISFNMIFVGGGKLISYFKKMRDQLNLSNEVTFVGNVSERNIITQFLVESDLFIFPSKSEGLPRVILEAMATGLPCLVSDVGGISELISTDFLLKDPNSVEELVKKIIILSKSKEMSKESLKNFNLACNEYNANHIQSKRREFYSNLKKISH